MFGGFGRTTVAAVAAGVAVAFGAGFITAKVLPA
jgi:methyl coenzyme M reductase alpha subunit